MRSWHFQMLKIDDGIYTNPQLHPFYIHKSIYWITPNLNVAHPINQTNPNLVHNINFLLNLKLWVPNNEN